MAQGFSIIDEGLRYSNFGNAAGGNWDGYYRYFVIKRGKENQIVSIAVLGKILAKNDPTFGNPNGHTTLVVAVDDFKRSHNSLQLDLEKFTEQHGNKMLIWHNGTLTVGKQGAASPRKVMRYIKRRAPHLISEDEKGEYISLGWLPTNRLIKWRDARDFVLNCAEYALLRDEYRAKIKRLKS